MREHGLSPKSKGIAVTAAVTLVFLIWVNNRSEIPKVPTISYQACMADGEVYSQSLGLPKDACPPPTKFLGVIVSDRPEVMGLPLQYCCTPGPWTALSNAVKSGNASELEFLLKTGTTGKVVDVNFIAPRHKAAINIAVGAYRLDLVKILIENGAAVNEPGWPLDLVYDDEDFTSRSAAEDVERRSKRREIRAYLISKGAVPSPGMRLLKEDELLKRWAQKLLGEMLNRRLSATQIQKAAESDLKSRSVRVKSFRPSKDGTYWEIEFTDHSFPVSVSAER